MLWLWSEANICCKLTFLNYLNVKNSSFDVIWKINVSSEFQDGIEFSQPRIHNPIYEIAEGCFSGNDVFDFNNRFNQPLFSNSADSSWKSQQYVSILSLLLSIVFYHLYWGFELRNHYELVDDYHSPGEKPNRSSNAAIMCSFRIYFVFFFCEIIQVILN